MKTPNTPGIFRDIPDEVYHSWDLPSNSRLSDLSHSPEACRWHMRNPKEQTPAMVFGTLCHTAILEPERIDREYVEPEPCGAILASGSRKGQPCGKLSAVPYGTDDAAEWLCGSHSKGMGEPLPCKTMTRAERKRLDRVASSVFGHPHAQKLIAACGERELSIVFPMGPGGRLYKSRIDGYAGRAGGILGDLKTCPDPTPEHFARSVVDRGYLRQLAMYRRALTHHGMPVAFASIVAVGSGEVPICRPYEVAGELIDLAEQELDMLAAEYDRRTREDDWIGHEGKAIPLDMPAWAERKLEAAATA